MMRVPTHFWLTWSERRGDYVRRATGETMTELVREANALGRAWHASSAQGGLWFELEPAPSRRRRRP